MKSINVVVMGATQTGKTSLCKTMSQKIEEKESEMPIHSFKYSDANITLFDTVGDPMDMKTSLLGCNQANTLILTIAADKGLDLQAAEKIIIANMYKISQGLILVTKSDLATPEDVESIKQKVKAFTKETTLKDLEVIPISSETGEGVPELRQKLSEFEETKPPTEGNFRFDVAFAYEDKGRGIARGVIKKGSVNNHSEIQLMPWGKSFPVDHLLFSDKEETEVRAGQMVGIAIRGVFPWDMPTGTVFCTKDTLKSSKEFTCELDIHPFYKEPFEVGQDLHTCVGMQWNKVEVKNIEGEFKPGNKIKLTLELMNTRYPLTYEPNEEFILTRPDLSIKSFRVCGKGKIISP